MIGEIFPLERGPGTDTCSVHARKVCVYGYTVSRASAKAQMPNQDPVKTAANPIPMSLMVVRWTLITNNTQG